MEPAKISKPWGKRLCSAKQTLSCSAGDPEKLSLSWELLSIYLWELPLQRAACLHWWSIHLPISLHHTPYLVLPTTSRQLFKFDCTCCKYLPIPPRNPPTSLVSHLVQSYINLSQAHLEWVKQINGDQQHSTKLLTSNYFGPLFNYLD